MIGICHLVYLQRWPEPKSEPESSRLDILLVQTYENKNIIALKIHNSFFCKMEARIRRTLGGSCQFRNQTYHTYNVKSGRIYYNSL